MAENEGPSRRQGEISDVRVSGGFVGPTPGDGRASVVMSAKSGGRIQNIQFTNCRLPGGIHMEASGAEPSPEPELPPKPQRPAAKVGLRKRLLEGVSQFVIATAAGVAAGFMSRPSG